MLARLIALTAVAAFASEPDALDDLRKLRDEGHLEQAWSLGGTRLARLEERGRGASPEAAELLDLLVDVAIRRHDFGEQARALAERAISAKEALDVPDPQGVATSRFAYGSMLFHAGDYAAARSQYERALEIRERALDPEHEEVGRTLIWLANTLQRQGEYPAAKPLYERAVAILEARFGPEHVEVANALHNYGNLSLRMGDHVAARAAYQRALAIRRAALGPRHADVALTLVTQGVLYQTTGDLSQAEAVLTEAIDICREVLPDSLLLSGALGNLGNVYWSRGESAKAAELYRQELAIHLRIQGPDHPDLARLYQNLATALKQSKDYPGALENYDRALALFEKRLGAEHPDLAHPLSNKANLLVLLGRYEDARPLYERALAIRAARLGQRHPLLAQSMLVLAGLDMLQGRRPDALSLATDAIGLHLDRIADTMAYLPESDALALANSGEQPESILFEGLKGARADEAAWLEACWNWALRSKGIVLEEMAARNRSVLAEETADARRAWEDLASARRRLGELWTAGPGTDDPQAYRAAVSDTLAAKQRAEERLAGLSVRYRGERVLRRADLAAARAALRQGEALVEIVRVAVGLPVYDDRPVHDMALVLRRDGTTASADLGLAATTDGLVAAWRAELTASLAAIDDPETAGAAMDRLERAGNALRRAVWDPIAQHLAGAAVVFLAPDGALHEVDFSALPARDGRYLIEEGPRIRILGAGRDVILGRGDPASAGRARGVLAIGSPDFDAAVPEPESEHPVFRGTTSNCEGLRGSTWPRLPAAARELQTVAELARGHEEVTLVTGARASEAEFLRAAPGHARLHVATHGFFLRDGCDETIEAENPLLHSGLVFAGANRAPGEGIVTAEEIAALDLRGLEIAVLSACDTGRGSVAVGEGVFGLRRAFELGGAHTVVMSLWPVPDRQTAQWMTRFYRALGAGEAPTEAGRRASLDSLAELRARERTPHPFLWSGFVVTARGR